eukprot:TRINITY_DN2270_c0_g1_i2.p1 TRINITY_DN2270_c0_g1~~TRINITY_DN2270_c0_g1_i2.p1  ORF type:complete len:245 (+),score=26.34 TRINITY_DN2270_c0_g1_i2:243-977(+)
MVAELLLTQLAEELIGNNYNSMEDVMNAAEEIDGNDDMREPTSWRDAVKNEQWLQSRQADFESAFLNGSLEETIYMNQAGGFDDGTGMVYRLDKSIYGLRQAANVWYRRVSRMIRENGYLQARTDPCLFLRADDDPTKPSWIWLYVDDLVAISSRSGAFDPVMQKLEKECRSNDLGEARFVLGIRLTRTSAGIHLSQGAMTRAMLAAFLPPEAKAVSKPLPGPQMGDSEGDISVINEEDRVSAI